MTLQSPSQHNLIGRRCITRLQNAVAKRGADNALRKGAGEVGSSDRGHPVRSAATPSSCGAQIRGDV